MNPFVNIRVNALSAPRRLARLWPSKGRRNKLSDRDEDPRPYKPVATIHWPQPRRREFVARNVCASLQRISSVSTRGCAHFSDSLQGRAFRCKECGGGAMQRNEADEPLAYPAETSPQVKTTSRYQPRKRSRAHRFRSHTTASCVRDRW